jgi:hypothetical protein
VYNSAKKEHDAVAGYQVLNTPSRIGIGQEDLLQDVLKKKPWCVGTCEPYTLIFVRNQHEEEGRRRIRR